MLGVQIRPSLQGHQGFGQHWATPPPACLPPRPPGWEWGSRFLSGGRDGWPEQDTPEHPPTHPSGRTTQQGGKGKEAGLRVSEAGKEGGELRGLAHASPVTPAQSQKTPWRRQGSSLPLEK